MTALTFITCHKADLPDPEPRPSPLTNFEKDLLQNNSNLVLIPVSDPTSKTELRYATINNFTGSILYQDLKHCILLRKVAEKLKLAGQKLSLQKPNYKLLLLDCLRPLSVQHKLWNKVQGTDKQKYVARPSRISYHNYGAAVDLTIIDGSGKELDMGTPFDFFGPEAEIRKEKQLLLDGKLTQTQLDNRLLLRRVMTESGFHTISIEWWHFNGISGEERTNYSPVP